MSSVVTLEPAATEGSILYQPNVTQVYGWGDYDRNKLERITPVLSSCHNKELTIVNHNKPLKTNPKETQVNQYH